MSTSRWRLVNRARGWKGYTYSSRRRAEQELEKSYPREQWELVEIPPRGEKREERETK